MHKCANENVVIYLISMKSNEKGEPKLKVFAVAYKFVF